MLVQNARDIVVFDEEQASYISSTDYTCALDISGHQARLLAEHEDAALAAADTQNRLLGTIRELEAEVMCQEGKLQAARDVEARACRERDNAQNACAQLQHQVCLLIIDTYQVAYQHVPAAPVKSAWLHSICCAQNMNYHCILVL